MILIFECIHFLQLIGMCYQERVFFLGTVGCLLFRVLLKSYLLVSSLKTSLLALGVACFEVYETSLHKKIEKYVLRCSVMVFVQML